MNPAQLAERVARESYGRLLSLLAARTRDLAAAEDALAEAFAAALTAWPRTGAPDNPEAWLFAAARRKLIDQSRRDRTAEVAQDALTRAAEEIETEMAGVRDLPDRRLGLLFACAHPAIEASVRTPLMLQTVLGFSAERIAGAFLVEPKAMGQRLVRAKAKIRDAGVSFEIPPVELWPERLGAVLDAVYAAYGVGWTDAVGADAERRGLALEALWLGRVLATLVPDEPEALALVALMLHLEARRLARRDGAGAFVPLDQQDVSLWRADLIDEADALIARAAAMKRPARYQYEAAIQSAHARRRERGEADWRAILLFYGALADLTQSPVAMLNGLAALARVEGAARAAQALEALLGEYPELKNYQPYWALHADLCARLGCGEEARAAYGEAISRECDPAVRVFLQAQAAKIS